MPVILLLTFLTVLASVLGTYGLISGKKNVIAQRLERIGMNRQADGGEELAEPFRIRVIQPMLKGLSESLIRITPKGIVSGLEKKITTAGMPFGFSVNEWVTLQALCAITVPAITATLGRLTGIPSGKIVAFAGIEMIVALLMPNLILISKIQQRQKEIMTTMPDILDLLTVSVEAGLGFDAALGKVVEKIPGVLSREFDKVIQEIRMGKPRKDALKNMSSRLNVVDLTTFIAAVIQADQLGVSVGNVLRIQSEQMRIRRRQRAQERAMKAPIKMLIPMVIFIFPTIFTVLLGPVAIKLITSLGK